MIRRLKENEDEVEKVDTLNELIDAFNFLNSKISLKQNFDGEIISVTFKASETKTIPHKLGKVPGGRIIIKQEGNGVLSDIPSKWTEKSIQMINNGAVTVTATILIVRE
jgi:hypothetical protein